MSQRAGMRCSSLRLRAVALAAAALLLCAGTARAQDVALPADLQIALITKILDFDRQVERYGSVVVLGIVYQPQNPESARLARELADAARAGRTAGPGARALRVTLLPFVASDPHIDDELRALGVHVVYFAPLRAAPLRRLVADAHAAGTLTVSGDADAIAAGVAIGLEARGARPGISVRLQQARAAGTDFDSRFLRLAEVRP